RDAAECEDVVAHRDLHAHGAAEDERGRGRAVSVAERGPRGEELVAGLPLAHLSEIEDEGSGETAGPAEFRGVVGPRRFEAGAENDVGDLFVAELAVDEGALLGREVADRARKVEQRAIRREPQRQLVVRGGHEAGTLGNERDATDRRLGELGPEAARVGPDAMPM